MPSDIQLRYPVEISDTDVASLMQPDVGNALVVVAGKVLCNLTPQRWGDTAPRVIPVPGVTVLGMRREVAFSSVAAGTLIETDRGARPAGELAAGDLVQTLDNGLQPLVWTSRRATPCGQAGPAAMPIRIAADALGQGCPSRPVVVAPDQRIMIDCPNCEAVLGHSQHLVAARDLLHLAGVERSTAPNQPMITLMCAAHEVLNVGGLWLDSFRPVDGFLNGLDDEQREDLVASNPRLRFAGGEAAYVSARPTLNTAEAAALL
jgi:hypothetical protein